MQPAANQAGNPGRARQPHGGGLCGQARCVLGVKRDPAERDVGCCAGFGRFGRLCAGGVQDQGGEQSFAPAIATGGLVKARRDFVVHLNPKDLHWVSPPPNVAGETNASLPPIRDCSVRRLRARRRSTHSWAKREPPALWLPPQGATGLGGSKANIALGGLVTTGL